MEKSLRRQGNQADKLLPEVYAALKGWSSTYTVSAKTITASIV